MPRYHEREAKRAIQGALSVTNLPMIGHGVSGYVYGYGDSALKVIKSCFKRELKIMQFVGNHENIVNLEKFFFIDSMIILQMPYCGLNGYLLTRKRGLVGEYLQKQAVRHLFTGLEYLHSKQILHLDPKPENTFYYKGRWLIGDMGNARHIKRVYSRQSIHYTRFYRSPMALCGLPSKNTDIFAMALCARELMCGEVLYDIEEEKEWNTFAVYFNRNDVSIFQKFLSDDSKAGLAILLRDTSQKKIVVDFADKTLFFKEFHNTLISYILTYSCSGAELFVLYWLDILKDQT